MDPPMYVVAEAADRYVGLILVELGPYDLNRAGAARSELFAAAGRGEIEVVVHELLPLDEPTPAHQKMDAGEVFGRIVLMP